MSKYTPGKRSLLGVLMKQLDTSLVTIPDQYASDKWAKKLNFREHVAMLVSSHLTNAKSLADISCMVAGSDIFSCSSIHKSSLSRINTNRSPNLFLKLFRFIQNKVRKRIPFSKLRALDTTTEMLNKVLFPLWPADATRAAVRIGMIYDPVSYMPDSLTISHGKIGDTTHGKKFRFKKNVTYLMDAGFQDYTLYNKIINRNAFFITKLHITTKLTVLEEYPVPESDNEDVIDDQLCIVGSSNRYKVKTPLRIVTVYSTRKKEAFQLATNRFDLSAQEVQLLYKKRWDIEVFFKFIKQNLKLKKFFGTSRNAITIQIYTALIAYLLAFLVKPKHIHPTPFFRTLRFALFLPASSFIYFDDS